MITNYPWIAVYNDIEDMNLDNSWFKTSYLSIKDAIKTDMGYVNKTNNEIIEINNIMAGAKNVKRYIK